MPKVGAMTGAPITSAITSAVRGEFVIASMKKNKYFFLVEIIIITSILLLLNVTSLHSND